MSIKTDELKKNLEKKINDNKSLYNKLREISPVINFTTKCYGSGKMSIPILDYEVEEVEGKAPPFKLVILEGHLMSSRPVPIRLDLVNNVNFDIVEHVFNLLAKYFRIIHEKAILRGHSGIKGLTTLTNVVETAAVDKITSDELVFLESKIYGVHLTKKCCWVMHPRTYSKIILLKDDVGRYSFIHDNAGLSNGFSTTILGYPVYVSENMPEPAPGEVALYFGDFSQIYCKFSENVNVQILREKYATQHAIGIQAELEFDAKLKDNDTKGIIALKFKA